MCAERRNKSGHHDQARVGHQAGDLGNPADIFHTVGIGKAKIPVQPMANIVAIEQVGVFSLGVELLFHDVGDGDPPGRLPVEDALLEGSRFAASPEGREVHAMHRLGRLDACRNLYAGDRVLLRSMAAAGAGLRR